MNDKKTTAEKLIELIRSMDEREQENVYYLIQGRLIGENTDKTKTAA